MTGSPRANNGNDRAEERSGREICAGARRAEMPERDDEKREAHAVAKKTDDAGKQSIERARQRSPGPKSKRDIDRPSNQPLELDNLQGIGQRDLSRQIVVEAPHDAGADDGDGADDALPASACRTTRATTAPATRQTMPSAILRSKFS